MIYHSRLLEGKARSYWDSFPCVLIAGARQVGKTTLAVHLFGDRAKVFTFDPVQDLYGERKDPDLFLRNNPAPIILDEIQYVPELVPALRRRVDEDRRPGRYIITGSQQWEIMKHLSESLAGRIAILDLSGFSLGEMLEKPGMNWLGTWMKTALATPDRSADVLLKGQSAGWSPSQVVWKGAYPEVGTLDERVVAGWMRGYVATYLQRDVRGLIAVRDETRFGAFLSLCAALTAQECNYSQMGRDIGLTTPTAQRWLEVMRGTYQWMEIPAYSNNAIKRLSMKPKGYLTDSGLACYLQRISSPESLSGHPLFGAMFETSVVMDIVKQSQSFDFPPAFHHYRLHSGAEVDLLLELDNRLFPIEIKASSRARPTDANGISRFQEQVGERAGPGIVVYAGGTPHRLTDRCIAIPYDLDLGG